MNFEEKPEDTYTNKDFFIKKKTRNSLVTTVNNHLTA